ncbi:hypothetical protein [Dysosmobacter sp. Sow4_B12]|uniref:hypothetical protein n=1 Tax=Dysosmobacter sp. Sow4_B12 TaxID=3438777 RepID=UPI003F9117B8
MSGNRVGVGSDSQKTACALTHQSHPMTFLKESRNRLCFKRKIADFPRAFMQNQ